MICSKFQIPVRAYSLRVNPKSYSRKARKGFTLIELLIVLGITATLATLGTVSYNSAIKKEQLDSYSKEIVSALEKARTKAVNQEQGDSWGVRFEANTSSAFSNFAIFQGATSGTDFIDVKKLNTNINFTSPNPSGATPIEEIVFNKSTGTVKDGLDHLIQISNGSITKDIYINKNGLISLGIPSTAGILSTPVQTSPANGTIIGLTTSQNLVWGAVVEAQTYRLQVSTDINFGSLLFDNNTIASTSYNVTGLQPYTTYYWRVNAYSLLKGSSLWSSTQSFSTITTPGAPVSPSGTGSNAKNVLIWSIPVNTGGSPITGYKIYWGTASGTYPNIINVGNVLTYNQAGLINGTTYYYKVAAINTVGTGSQTSEFNSMPFLPPVITVAVTPSTAIYIPGTVAALTGTITSNGIVTSCEYTLNGGTNWYVATVSGSIPSYTCTQSAITGFADGSSYTLNMRATNNSGTTAAIALTRIGDTNGPMVADNWTNNWTASSSVTVTLTSTDNQYLPNSEFSDISTSYSPGWDADLNLTYAPSTGFSSGYNSGVPLPSIGYHAHINPTAGVGSTPGFEYIDLNCQYGYCHRWLGTAYGLGTAASRNWRAGTQITVTLDGKVDAIGKPVAFGVYYTNLSGTTNFLSGLQQQTFAAINTWETKTYTFTLVSDIDTSKGVSLYIYGSYGTEGSLWVDNVKLFTAGSGVFTTKYCVDTTNTCNPSTGTPGISASVTCVSGSTCTQYVRYASWDNVNNASAIYSKTVRQDKTIPTVTDNWTDSWTATPLVTVTLTPTDGSGSGISITKYCVDTANTCIPSTDTTGTSIIIVCAPGAVCTQYLRYQSTDNVGNVSIIMSEKIRQDTSISGNGLVLNLDGAKIKNGNQNLSLINSSSWTVGTGSATGYSVNGLTTENQRIAGTDPFGHSSIVWGSYPSGDSNGDGGWNGTSFSIDNTKPYRFSVWMRRTSDTTTGSFYLGLQGLNSASTNTGVKNIANNTITTNPYWAAIGISSFTKNQWYLVTGYVYPYDTANTVINSNSGYYTIANGATKVMSIGTEYKWLATTARSLHRSYHFYATDPTSGIQFFDPRVDIADGTEPSIADLLNNKISTVDDLSGSANNATLINSVGYSSTEHDGSLIFDGVNDYADAGAGASLNVTNEVTLSAWIYPKSSNIGTIIAKNGPYYLAFGNSQISQTQHVGAGILSGTWTWVNGNTIIPLNQWSHIAMRYDGSTIKVYLNGNEDGSTTKTGTMGAFGDTVKIGYGTPGYGQYFNGLIDDVRIYNRALSAEEIAASYANTTDTASPTVTDNWTNNWTATSSVTVTLTSTDGSGSGISTTKYCVDTTNTCNPSTGTPGISASVTCASGVCRQYVRYAAWDVAGNASAVYSEVVRQDKQIPVATDDWTNTWTLTTPVIVTITSADIDSGVATTKYCVDTANTCTPTTVGTSASLTCASDSVCTQYVRYASWDNVNNASAIYSETVRQDILAPTNPALTATAGNVQNVLSWTTSSDTGSGLNATTPYKLVYATGATAPADCSGTTLYSGTATTYTHTGLINGTQYSYRICSIDALSNMSGGGIGSAISGNTLPTAGTLTITTSTASYVPGTVTTMFAPFTSNGTVTSCEYTLNGGTNWYASTLSGSIPNYTCTQSAITGFADGSSYTLNMRATNGAGTTTATAATRTGDTVGPTVTDNWTNNWTATPSVTVTFTPTDARSGVASTNYCVDTVNTCTPSTGTTYVSPFSVTCASGSACTQYVRYASWDKVNNASAVYSETVRQDLTIPTNPTLTATAGNAQNVLSWTASSDTGSGLNATTPYKLVYATGATAPANCNTGTSLTPIVGTSFTHTGLANGTSYSYRICSIDAVLNMAAGTTASATPVNPAVYCDNDGDGHYTKTTFASCTGVSRTSPAGDDCNDSCATCYPGSVSYTLATDGLDQDCNGVVDNLVIYTSSHAKIISGWADTQLSTCNSWQTCQKAGYTTCGGYYENNGNFGATWCNTQDIGQPTCNCYCDCYNIQNRYY